MKKESLLNEIILRVSRIAIVTLLSFLLYPHLISFIKKNEEIIGFSFVISSIIIYIVMLIISGIYFVLKKLLLGGNYDKKNKLITYVTHILIILIYIFLVIKTYDVFGTSYAFLGMLGLEIYGLLNSMYDKYTDSNKENVEIELKT
jgi:hypothetical protein